MERKVSVYPFPFGTRVFMHRNGVIREAEYRGMRIKRYRYLWKQRGYRTYLLVWQQIGRGKI